MTRSIFIRLFFIALFLTLSCNSQKENSATKSPTTIKSVNLEKYAGLWYEIARLPNRFQEKCARNTTAEYSLRQDGLIDVVNSCTKENGEVIKARGVAKVVDKDSNSRLKVSFVNLLGLQLFWGDYWIIGLKEDYRYAIVGEPSRKYGWVLSRTPKMTPVEWAEARMILMNKGYDPDDFAKTVQE
jgi:apolipoprotein D and lipocalin family protein